MFRSHSLTNRRKLRADTIPIDTPDLMAAASMQQRPYQPVYHTPQSNSPASVASSQSYDPNGRLYGQQPQQMQQPMYGYPQYQAPMNQNYPTATKLEPPAIQQRPLDPNSLPQRPTPGPISSGHNAPSGSQANGHLNPGQAGRNGSAPGNGGAANGQNPNAAPGPIPATTPTVVRQDQNGVQWIAFEYSRDRVKMEYTIRCDVESVNVDQLGEDSKTENCVYPRANCNKDQYRGNRLNYETECNTVGWALAELNPCLRGKRGLIQRAVDSWRNSNQDPRLRSRRVRRQAKIQTRKQVQAPHPSQLSGPGGPGIGGGGGDTTGVTPGPTPMAAPVQRPQPPSSMMMGSSRTHHHHAHPDGSAPGGSDEVSANASFTPQQRQHQSVPKRTPPNDVRQHQVFPGYPHYPTHAGPGGIALTPSLHDGVDGPLSTHPNVHPSNPSAVVASAPMTAKLEDGSHDDQSKESRAPSATSTNIFGDLPEAKRRKFISVEDPDGNRSRIRIRATLDTVDTSEIPDSYRKANSVYPRSYFPVYMQSPKRRASRGNRFSEDDEEGGGKAEPGESEADEEAVMGRTLVPVPMMEGHEGELAVPKIGRAKRRREEQVNDLGYRMAWQQSRAFAPQRTLFLQRALDIYREKTKTQLIAGGHPVAAHLETRIGKRKWLARKGKARMKSE
ncbi:MAG: hypothetical protein Q9168_002582 [Polycauliona sp. 1 TL-2023]